MLCVLVHPGTPIILPNKVLLDPKYTVNLAVNAVSYILLTFFRLIFTLGLNHQHNGPLNELSFEAFVLYCTRRPLDGSIHTISRVIWLLLLSVGKALTLGFSKLYTS